MEIQKKLCILIGLNRRHVGVQCVVLIIYLQELCASELQHHMISPTTISRFLFVIFAIKIIDFVAPCCFLQSQSLNRLNRTKTRQTD